MFYKLRYFRNTQHTKLSQTEKSLLRNNLHAFMQSHPVRVESQARQLEKEGQPNFLHSLTSMLLKPLPMTLSALLLLGGGTAFAAEQALPNQALYPIKIQVNERVRAALTPTVEGQAKWETEVAARRLKEAEELAAQNKLQASVQTEVATNFDEQAKLVQIKIAQLKSEGNADAALKLSAEFNALLQAHQAIVTKLAIEAQADQQTLPDVDKNKVDNNKLDTSGKTDDATKDDDTKVDGNNPVTNPSIDSDAYAALKLEAYKKQQTANTAIANAKVQMSSVTILSAELKDKIARLISLSGTEVAAGDSAFNQADFKVALNHYTQAQTYADEAIALLKTTNALEIHVPVDLKTDNKTEEKTTITSESATDGKTQLENNQTTSNLKIDPTITQNLKFNVK